MAGGICNIQTNEVEFTWEIRDFNKVKIQMETAVQEGKPVKIDSNKFYTQLYSPDNEKTRWNLNLEYSISYSYKIICKHNVSYHYPAAANATVQFFILNNEQKKEQLNDAAKVNFNDNNNHLYSCKIPSTCINNDRLTVICHLVHFGRPTSTPLPSFNNYPANLLKDIKNLLINEQHSDVTLMVNETEFKVHKLILSARSPVFEAMFSHKDLKESQTNQVAIIDTSPEAMKKFLEFIYSGKIEKLDNEKLNLWKLADKYQLETLKNYCEEYISCNVNEKCVLEVLKFANLHDIKKLLDQTLIYFLTHCKKTIKNGEWKSLAATDPKLFDLILNYLAQGY